MNNNNLQLKAAIVLTALVFSISSSTASIYNKTCFNPSAYNGSASWTNPGSTTMTCDGWYAAYSDSSGSTQPLENVTWATLTASTYPKTFDAIQRVNSLTPTCCSDGKSLLWTDYSKSCYTNSAYNGAAVVTAGGQTQSCNAWYNQFSYVTGDVLTGVNWATVTASAYPTNDNGIASGFKDTCCSDGKSLLWTDYSKSCYTNSAYNGSAFFNNTANTCDDNYAMMSQTGQHLASVNWATVTASDVATANLGPTFDMFKDDCCTDGKSITYVDYSKFCKTPSTYTGTATLTGSDGTPATCDVWLGIYSGTSQPLENVNWGTVTASTYPTNNGVAALLGPICCSDGKSITYTPPTDYSKSCYNNSAYSGSVSWTHPTEGVGSNTCDGWYDLFSDATNGVASMKTLNWATVTASTYPTDAEAVERVTMLSPACCSDGKSILWTAATTTTSAPGLDESSSKSSSGMNVFVITLTLLALFSTL